MSHEVLQASQEFWLEFRDSKAAIEAVLAGAEAHASSAEVLARAKTDLAALEKRVNDATVFLPPYDQRQCALQLRELGDAILKLQAPRAKFSFKSKRPAKPSAPAAAAHAASPSVEPSAPAAETPTALVASANSLVFSDMAAKHHRASGASQTPAGGPAPDLSIRDIRGSIVDLRAVPLAGAVHIKNVCDSVVLCGAISGSVLVEKCVRCVIVFAACRQCRIHESSATSFFLRVSSHPIIEDCSGICFAAVPLDDMYLPDLAQRLQTADIDLDRNEFDCVEDFNWLRQQASPNWRAIAAADASEPLSALVRLADEAAASFGAGDEAAAAEVLARIPSVNPAAQ